MSSEVAQLLKTAYEETTSSNELAVLKEILNSFTVLEQQRNLNLTKIKGEIDEWEKKLEKEQMSIKEMNDLIGNLKNLATFENQSETLDFEIKSAENRISELEGEISTVETEVSQLMNEVSEEYVDSIGIKLKLFKHLGYEIIQNESHGRLRVYSQTKDDVTTLEIPEEVGFDFVDRVWELNFQ